MKNILFIGAGASFGARVSNTDDKLPLGKNLLKWMREQSTYLLNTINEFGGVFNEHRPYADRIRSIIKNSECILFDGSCSHTHFSTCPPIQQDLSKIDNYELFIASIYCKNCRILIQKLLQILFCDLSFIHKELTNPFKEKQDLYDSLVSKLKINTKDWAIISLNYDILFEDALRRANISFKYYGLDNFFENYSLDHLLIFKPHGSINFFSKADIQTGSYSEPIIPPRPTGFTKGKQNNTQDQLHPEHPILYSQNNSVNVLLEMCQSDRHYPMMANFAQGKESETNNDTFHNIRRAALNVCYINTNLYMIGVKPIHNCEDDMFVASLLEKKFGHVLYVTNDEADMNIICKNHPMAMVFNHGLEDFLDRYEENLQTEKTEAILNTISDLLEIS